MLSDGWDRWVTAVIGLGSNLGDRRALLDSAVRALAGLASVRMVAVSRLIETEPVGPAGQGRYLNGAARVHTGLAPRALLDACLVIEAAHGRRRAGPRWGARTLDLDLLLFGSLIIDEPGLQVPHPRLEQRRFVLAPLAEIAGEMVHPRLGVPIQSLHDAVRPPTAVE